MLTLITGLPGAGKTLNTIAEIDQEYGRTRAIYYHGIRDLSFSHWTQLDDPQEWPECPDGSLIVIDEAQGPWPARGNTGQKPPAVAAVETHRHHGFDLFFITQDAKLLDHNLRRLAGRHIHFWRPFGMNRTTRWEWQRCVDPDDWHQRKEAISKRVVKLPSKYFSAYRSAEVHTVKRRVPKKMLIFPALIVVFIALGYAGWSVLSGLTQQDVVSAAVLQRPAPGRIVSPVARSPRVAGHIVGVLLAADIQRFTLLRNDGMQAVVGGERCHRETGLWVCQLSGQRYTEVRWIEPRGQSEYPDGTDDHGVITGQQGAS